jgi:hypothetical protein
METDSTDVVEMAFEKKHLSLGFVVPADNFVIVTSGDEERLVRMEVDATDRTWKMRGCMG